MEMQIQLNEMLREKLHKEFDEQFECYRSKSESAQRDMLHTMFIYQEIVTYFDEHNVSSKEAASLMEHTFLLDDLYDEWFDCYDGKCETLFEAFLETEIALEGASLYDTGV